MKQPLIEVAIIFKNLNSPFLLESVEKCLKLDYDNFIVTLYPDIPMKFPMKDKRIRIIPTGVETIPVKRNIAVDNLKEEAEFIAFIDSDAFPEPSWLRNAVRYFADKRIIAVGGPNLTPRNDKFSRQISGLVMRQEIGVGSAAVRNKIRPSRFIDELPTCNLIIRGSYARLNEFDENQEIGEDTKYCHEIIKKGYKVFYAEDVVVFHHRRNFFSPLMRQFYRYGYYRAKSYSRGPESTRLYALPALFLLYIAAGALISLFFPFTALFFIGSIAVYYIICLLSSLKEDNNLLLCLFASGAIFFCHLSYGYGFFKHCVLKFLHLDMSSEERRILQHD